MPDATWWALHAAQDAALVTAMAMAWSASRRAGAHTPYGQMLFLLAVGFWFLLLGEAAFLVRQGLGVWGGPGGLPDLLSLPGWLLMVASVSFFVVQFSHEDSSKGRIALFCAIAAALIGALFFAWLSPPGADPVAHVRLAYLAIDAVGIGIIVGGHDRFRRLHRSALGRLYLFLGAAIIIKASGDLLWAYLAARQMSSPVATALYPLAGALALIGLAIHHRDMGKDRIAGAPVGAPWMQDAQATLHKGAARLQEMAGGYAARTYLQAAGRAFTERGIAWSIQDGTLIAAAPTDVWTDAVTRGSAFAGQHLGSLAQRALAREGP